ncbi:class I SAM-dependent methyltransferase [Salipiger mucosus]|uniref:Putative methyltransferase n=1 Tax=Salipiger mucosus DSM 16094 TaxID=1123237 RepID=S9S9X7_9RHOB|nr:class I SAM-dependent methyltransferase [Salipiger mucosus]EPX86965.1 putative methyltransferase [Salipiger mucosus DSM 16094]
MSAAFWDRVAERYAARPVGDSAAYEATLARVRHWLGPEMEVLELGCGTGSTAIALAEAAGRITATDVSGEMIRIAQGKAGPANLTFRQAGVDEALTGRFDVVRAFNLLHLLEDRSGTLRAVRAVLPERGLFISKTPCLAAKWWLRPVVAAMRMAGKAPRLQFLSVKGLEAAVREAGFEILETGDYPPRLPGRFIVARRLPDAR